MAEAPRLWARSGGAHMNTVIEIAAIRPPKEGKKKSAIVSKDGRSFLMWPDKAVKLAVEQRYGRKVSSMAGPTAAS